MRVKFEAMGEVECLLVACMKWRNHGEHVCPVWQMQLNSMLRGSPSLASVLWLSASVSRLRSSALNG